MITFACPHCNNPFKVEEKYAGQYGWCPVCNGFFFVPRPGETDQNKNLTLQEKLDFATQQLRQLSARYKKSVMAMEAAEKRVRELHNEIESLQEVKDIARSTQAAMDGIEALHSRTVADLKEQSELRGRLEERTLRQEDELARMQAALTDLESHRAAREKESRDETAILRAKLDESQAASQRLHRDLETIASGADSAGEHSAGLRLELERASKEIAALRTIAASNTASNAAFDAIVREVAELRSFLESNRETDVQRTSEIRQLRDQLAESESNSRRLKDQLASHATHPNENAERISLLTEEIEKLKQAASTLRDEKASLEENVRDAERRAEVIRHECEMSMLASDGQVEAIEHELTLAERELALLRPLAEHAQTLETEIGVVRVRLESTEARLREYQAMNATARETESVLRSRLEEADRQERGAIETRLEETLAHLQHFRTSLLLMTEGGAAPPPQLGAEIERMLSDLSSERRSRIELDDELKSTRGKLDESQKQVVSLTQELGKLSHDLAAMDGRKEQEQRKASSASSQSREPDSASWRTLETGEVLDDAFEDSGDGLTIIPEIIDEEYFEAKDAMADALLRFIRPE